RPGGRVRRPLPCRRTPRPGQASRGAPTAPEVPSTARDVIVGANTAGEQGRNVRSEEHIGWGRDFPVRYLLVREYYDDNGEQAGELWGRCAEVEGLFMDPPPLPREVLTLRGCPRNSTLAQAVTRSVDPVRLLGDGQVVIHPADPSNDGPTRFW